MGLRINQNITALNAYRNLSVTDAQMSKSLEKLSSGFRINRAGDDAAGLVVSEALRAQVGGLKVAARNAQDGISVVQTAEGALTEVHSMLQRMRDLAVQSASTGSQDSDAVQAAQTELDALNLEITRIGGSTKFGTQSLLGGSYGTSAATKLSTTDADGVYNTAIAAADSFTMTFSGSAPATGALGALVVTLPAVAANFSAGTIAGVLQTAINSALAAGTSAQQAMAGKVSVTSATVGAGSTLTIAVSGLPATGTFSLANTTNTPLTELGLTGAAVAASGTAASFQVGANAGDSITLAITGVSATALGTGALSLATSGAAGTAITTINTAITTISNARASLGGSQNRLEHALANVNTTVENLSASESRIRDTDMAAEMTSFSRAQILSQAGTAMLAQANQSTQNILTLFR